MKEFKTDFEFKDNRNYVHSTTMIEDLCRLIYGNFYPESEWEMHKIDAKFHKEVLCNGKFLIAEDISELPESDTASADFRFYNATRSIYAAFVEDKGASVTKRIKTNYRVEDIVLEKDFSGTCRIGCPDRAAFVENVIEANKRMHLLTLKDKNKSLKVINLYMKKFPAFVPDEAKELLLKIENISVRQREGSLATLNSLYFPNVQSIRFEIAYVVDGL